jgi:hypothetical protein
VEFRMTPHFISAGALTKQQHALFWPSPNDTTRTPGRPAHAGQGSLDSQSGRHVVDPTWYVGELRNLYSVPDDPVLTARASSEDGQAWWPEWVFSAPTLRPFIGRAVECTEDPDLFQARFVWVGVPFPGSAPCASDVGAPSRPFTPCMVSLVTHAAPSEKPLYIWCTVNRDGDVVQLSREVLCALLAPQIAELKSYVQRTGDRKAIMAVHGGNGIPTEDYVQAAKLMCMDIQGIPKFASPGLLPFQDPETAVAPVPADGSFLTPVQTTVLPTRMSLLTTARESIALKRNAGQAIPHPFLPENATPEQRAVFTRFLQYMFALGQFDPEVKEVLQVVPHGGDVAATHADVAFREFVRVCGNLTGK